MVGIPKNSYPSKFKKILLQKCKNWDLTENTFWSITLVVIKVQKRTVPHFEDNFLINDLFHSIKALRAKLKPLYLKMLVWVIMVHPLKGITQLWWPLTLKPFEVKEQTAPHSKTPICFSLEFGGKG